LSDGIVEKDKNQIKEEIRIKPKKKKMRKKGKWPNPCVHFTWVFWFSLAQKN